MKTYIVRAGSTDMVKIGKSKDPQKRLRELQTGAPHKLRLVDVIDGDFEAEMHARWADRREGGEWFRILPHELGRDLNTVYVVDPDGVYQGFVDAGLAPAPGLIAVRLFEWLSGYESGAVRMYTVDRFTDGSLRLFADVEAFRRAASRIAKEATAKGIEEARNGQE